MIKKVKINKKFKTLNPLKYKKSYVITSSIACGKTTFLKIAKKNDIKCLSADEISSMIFRKKSKKIKKKLKIKCKNFNFLSLKEQKNIVASIIFSNKLAKKRLEILMHKRIKKEIIHEINSYQNKLIFIEIPLFFENLNYNFLLNKIVIYCPYEISLKRLMNRNNLSLDEAKLRLDSQINIEKKLKFATITLKNDGNLDEFKDNSLKLIQKLKDKYAFS